MAIVVEEEQKSRGGLVSLIVWGVVFVVIGLSVYYLFFKRPDLVEVAAPSSFTNTQALSQIVLEPNDVINSPGFKALHGGIQPIVPQPSGRPNPFLGNF